VCSDPCALTAFVFERFAYDFAHFDAESSDIDFTLEEKGHRKEDS
jgi:hypothetical protein